MRAAVEVGVFVRMCEGELMALRYFFRQGRYITVSVSFCTAVTLAKPSSLSITATA